MFKKKVPHFFYFYQKCVLFYIKNTKYVKL